MSLLAFSSFLKYSWGVNRVLLEFYSQKITISSSHHVGGPLLLAAVVEVAGPLVHGLVVVREASDVPQDVLGHVVVEELWVDDVLTAQDEDSLRRVPAGVKKVKTPFLHLKHQMYLTGGAS